MFALNKHKPTPEFAMNAAMVYMALRFYNRGYSLHLASENLMKKATELLVGKVDWSDPVQPLALETALFELLKEIEEELQ